MVTLYFSRSLPVMEKSPSASPMSYLFAFVPDAALIFAFDSSSFSFPGRAVAGVLSTVMAVV
jgi:hypothetical protein